MRPGATKIETDGSWWWFDEDAHEYMRLPKHEAPRERPEWSDQRAGALQDAVWHPYGSFAFEHLYFQYRLVIRYDDGSLIASAPGPKVTA